MAVSKSGSGIQKPKSPPIINPLFNQSGAQAPVDFKQLNNNQQYVALFVMLALLFGKKDEVLDPEVLAEEPDENSPDSMPASDRDEDKMAVFRGRFTDDELTEITGLNQDQLENLRDDVKDQNFEDPMKAAEYTAQKIDYRNFDFKRPLLEMIASKESRGNYNVLWGGETANLTSMTIEQVLNKQKEIQASGKESCAAGCYQFMPDTLRETVDWLNARGANIDIKTALFDEEMQDRLAIALMEKRCGMNEFLAGQKTPAEFAYKLSTQWAALPKDAGGESYYKGVGSNKAGISFEKVISTLNEMKAGKLREEYALAAGGKTHDVPAHETTPGQPPGVTV